MVEETFNLSEKGVSYYETLPEEHKFYSERNVKEFIKRLRQKIKNYRTATYNMKFLQKLEEDINKLAGENFI